jgi:hypothetical protein
MQVGHEPDLEAQYAAHEMINGIPDPWARFLDPGIDVRHR